MWSFVSWHHAASLKILLLRKRDGKVLYVEVSVTMIKFCLNQIKSSLWETLSIKITWKALESIGITLWNQGRAARQIA